MSAVCRGPGASAQSATAQSTGLKYASETWFSIKNASPAGTASAEPDSEDYANDSSPLAFQVSGTRTYKKAGASLR
jgi:hypothetical protein